MLYMLLVHLSTIFLPCNCYGQAYENACVVLIISFKISFLILFLKDIWLLKSSVI